MKELFKIKFKEKIKAYTLIEVLISITILSALFLVLGQTILTIYKANQYISTLNTINTESSIALHIIKKVLISASPESVKCDPPAPGGKQDINNDGQNDKFLLKFRTVDGKNEYLLVLHKNEVVPYSMGNMHYNKLVLYKYNNEHHRFEEYVSLTNPDVTFNNIDVECSSLTNDTISNISFVSVTFRGSLDSLNKYLFIPKLNGQHIVKDYPIYTNVLIQN